MRTLALALLLAVPTAGALAQGAGRDLERAAVEADQRAAALRRDADAADLRARKARFNAIVLARRVQESEARATAVEQRLRTIRRELAGQRARLAGHHAELARLLAALQTLSRRPAALVLLEPESAINTARVSALLSSVRPAIATRTAALQADLAVLEQSRRRLANARVELVAVERRMTTALAELDAMQADARATRDRLDAEADSEQARARALANRAIDLRGLARAVERDAGQRRQTHGSMVVARQEGAYRLPASGLLATRFGTMSSNGVRARGLTLTTRGNAQVTAPAGGRVAYAGPFRDYGDIVIIEHVDARVSLLSGMERVDVVVGETVETGAPVGRMGPDARNLYLELRSGGRPVDPLRATGRAG